jgi:hypothetical protein
MEKRALRVRILPERQRVDLRGVNEPLLGLRVELFHRSNSSCGARCGALVICAIVVAAGEQGASTTELAQDDFSHSPPHVNGLGSGAAKPRVSGSVDRSGVCFCLVETALDHVGSGDGCTECLDQFLDQLVRDVAPDILELCLGENGIERSDHSHSRSQRTITGTTIPKLPIQARDLSLTQFQLGLGLLQGNGIVLLRSARRGGLIFATSAFALTSFPATA